MGEKEKKPEEGKKEAAEAKEKPEAKDEETEAKADERKDRGDGKEEEKKEGGDEETKAEAPAPPPRKEIEMHVFTHCEGCARKVKRSLKGLEGGFGSYMLSRTYQLMGADYPGNRAEDVKNLSLSWMIGFMFVASFLGLFSLVMLRKQTSSLPGKVSKHKFLLELL